MDLLYKTLGFLIIVVSLSYSQECGPGYVACAHANGTGISCVNDSVVCDGVMDCVDGSDEVNCTNSSTDDILSEAPESDTCSLCHHGTHCTSSATQCSCTGEWEETGFCDRCPMTQHYSPSSLTCVTSCANHSATYTCYSGDDYGEAGVRVKGRNHAHFPHICDVDDCIHKCNEETPSFTSSSIDFYFHSNPAICKCFCSRKAPGEHGVIVETIPGWQLCVRQCE